MSASSIGGGAITGASIGAKTGPLAPFAVPIGAGVGALVGWLAGRKKKKSPDDAMQQLLAMQLQHYQQQQPLRDAVQSMAMNRLRSIYPQGMPGQPQTGTYQDPIQNLLRVMTQR